jgi:hypothetical protein
MKENSPICARLAEISQRDGRMRKATTISEGSQRLADDDDEASRAEQRPGPLIRSGVEQHADETKNSTANASRSGSDSSAA